MTKKWKTLWQKEKLLVLSNFSFCHYVFKTASAAEASESVYMRERVKSIPQDSKLIVCKKGLTSFSKLYNIEDKLLLLYFY